MVNWTMIGAMVLPNVGGWAGALTMTGEVKSTNGTAWYETIRKPKWNPPNWVFGPAWTSLYCSMGYASYLVYRDCGGITDESVVSLSLYGAHLLINWTWTPVFFKLHKIGLAFFHILALDAAATACTISFFNINKNTLYFMAPYLGWLTFATFLNYTIWQLNGDDEKKKINQSVVPLSLYGAHLLINWTWTPVFFKLHKIGLAFFHILALDAAATACTISFFNINKNTLYFMAPYLGWLTFATFLNYTIWQLNGDDEKKKISK